MTRRLAVATGPFLLVLALVFSCAPAAPPSAPPTGATPAAPRPADTPKPAPSAGKPAPEADPLAQIIEGARKEGVVKVNLASPLGDVGAQRLIDGVNKKYGLNLKIEYTPAAKMEAVHSQVMTEIQTGGPPTWDLVMGLQSHFVDYVQRDMLPGFDWAKAFPQVPPESILFGGGAVAFATSFDLPAYNPNLVKAEDVPRRWEDTADPKWKGKLVMHNSVSAWVRLTQGLGEERVSSLLQGLARQQPLLVQAPQVVPRLTSGEYPLAVPVLATFIYEARDKGAPARYADDVRPVAASLYALGVPKRAEHPNSARLLVAFSVTPEGQQIWWETGKYASHLVPGTPVADFVKGKELLFDNIDMLLKDGPRLEEKYLKILGLK